MSRAPSTLPFELQPNPSPQQILHTRQIAQKGNERFVSNICRGGPAPLSRHHITDPACLVLYLLLLIATIVLFCINYFSGKLTNTINFSQLAFFQKLSYSLNQTLPQTLLSAACIIAAGIIILGVVISVPIVAGFLIILACIGLLGYIIYSLFAGNWGDIWYQLNQKQQTSTKSQSFRIALIVITCLAIVFIFFFIAKRIRKLKNLGNLMRVVKVVLMSNMPFLPLIMIFLLSGINMGVWVAFVQMIWNCVRMQLSQGLPIAPVFLLIMAPILWLWTHGFMLALSDYICQSWVLHWYFNANNQTEMSRGQQNWKSSVFKKLIRYHLGTCLYGVTISAYVSENLVRIIKKIIKSREQKPAILQKISYLSRYAYVQTIMECFSFCDANREMYLLRQRIKQKIPQIYMLGHFVQQILKIFLCLGALCLWFVFTYHFDNFMGITAVDFSFGLFLCFSFVLLMGLFLQVSTNISHLFGIVSDTAVIAYCIDCQIERVHYQQNLPRSVPPQLRTAFQKLQLQIVVDNNMVVQKNQNSIFNDSPHINNNLQSSNVQPYYQPVNQNPYPSLSVNNPASPGYLNAGYH